MELLSANSFNLEESNSFCLGNGETIDGKVPFHLFSKLGYT